MLLKILAILVGVGVLGSAPAPLSPPQLDVLVFTKTAGFRHGSIPAGVAALNALGDANGFSVTQSEDASIMTDQGLEPFEVVVFLSTTGDILNSAQQDAFERYIQGGGGFVGIHAATDTEYDWPWYGRLVGAYFANHPSIQDAEINVEDADHPSTAHLPKNWPRRDEWYNFRTNPRTDPQVKARVLATLNESTYNGGNMGDDHPIMWCHEYDGGRSWYFAGGHTNQSFSEPLVLDAILGGIRWAARKPNKIDQSP